MITVVKKWDAMRKEFWYYVMDNDTSVKLFLDPDKAIEFAAGLVNPEIIPDEVIWTENTL